MKKLLIAFLILVSPLFAMAQNTGAISMSQVKGKDTNIVYWVFKKDYQECLKRFEAEWGAPKKNKLGKKVWKRIDHPEFRGARHVKVLHGVRYDGGKQPLEAFKDEEHKAMLMKKINEGAHEMMTIVCLGRWCNNVGNKKGLAGRAIKEINRVLADVK